LSYEISHPSFLSCTSWAIVRFTTAGYSTRKTCLFLQNNNKTRKKYLVFCTYLASTSPKTVSSYAGIWSSTSYVNNARFYITYSYTKQI